MFGGDRQTLRRVYADAWQTKQRGEALQPLQRQIVAVIENHPEYHALLDNAAQSLERDFPPEFGETNPFLHMAMHLALAEQLATDRPAGVREIYQKLTSRLGDAHRADHRMMECLGEVLWRAQRDAAAPDESAYLACLKKLAAT